MKSFGILLMLSAMVLTTNIMLAGEPQTILFARNGGQDLYMDVYRPDKQSECDACVITIFGGGFIGGARDTKQQQQYCRALADNGFVAVSIDYRLGLKGVKKVGIANVKALENAIMIAVEDTYSATRYIIDHAAELGVDTACVILSGSSAGAITALQADYMLANSTPASQVLPAGFRYAGIVSFAGAIFSREGRVDWKNPPAPTLLYHGTSDRLVNYNQIRFLNIGLFGSNALVKRFVKYGYPYYIIRMNNLGHQVAGRMMDNFEDTMWFIDNYCNGERRLQIDKFYNDPSIIPAKGSAERPKDLYQNQ